MSKSAFSRKKSSLPALKSFCEFPEYLDYCWTFTEILTMSIFGVYNIHFYSTQKVVCGKLTKLIYCLRTISIINYHTWHTQALRWSQTILCTYVPRLSDKNSVYSWKLMNSTVFFLYHWIQTHQVSSASPHDEHIHKSWKPCSSLCEAN